MFRWLDLAWLNGHFAGALFVLLCLVTGFLLVSRRMNARVEAAAAAPRLLTQLSQSLAPKPAMQKKKGKAARYAVKKKGFLPEKARRRLAWLLEKTDWLVYDKLKLLPDARTGRRLNFFMMLLVCWMTSKAYALFADSALLYRFIARDNGMTQQSQLDQNGLLRAFFLMLPYVLAWALPFFFARRNREFYFDVLALGFLLCLSAIKLVICWGTGCCFGIPCARGVYNETLDATVFPVQLAEFGVGILCCALCVLFMLFAKSYRPGRGCSFCLLSYAATRFFWDYLRYQGERYRYAETNVIFGLSVVQVVCVAACALALVWLLVLPLEKKMMDRLWTEAARGLRGLAARVYFHPRAHPRLSKWLKWNRAAAALEKNARAAREQKEGR